MDFVTVDLSSYSLCKEVVELASSCQVFAPGDFTPINDYKEELVIELQDELGGVNGNPRTLSAVVKFFDDHDVWAPDSDGRAFFVGLFVLMGAKAS